MNSNTTGIQVISAMQARRATRTGDTFLVMVTERDNLVTSSGDVQQSDDNVVTNHVVSRLKTDYADILTSEAPTGLPPHREVNHTIPLVNGNQIVYKGIYRMSPLELKEVEKQIGDLLSRGLIRPSTSPFGSPILFVRKRMAVCVW